MTNKEISKNLARHIFKCGDELNSPATRIQFMGGSWSDKTEVPQGGFVESALREEIWRWLCDNIPDEPPKDS